MLNQTPTPPSELSVLLAQAMNKFRALPEAKKQAWRDLAAEINAYRERQAQLHFVNLGLTSRCPCELCSKRSTYKPEWVALAQRVANAQPTQELATA